MFYIWLIITKKKLETLINKLSRSILYSEINVYKRSWVTRRELQASLFIFHEFLLRWSNVEYFRAKVVNYFFIVNQRPKLLLILYFCEAFRLSLFLIGLNLYRCILKLNFILDWTKHSTASITICSSYLNKMWYNR